MRLFARFIFQFIGSIGNRPLSCSLLSLWVLSALFSMGISTAGTAHAEPCFIPVYYELIFKAEELERLSAGDPRLVAVSDLLAARGKDPHCGEEGCMDGVNHGRWDQVLINSALGDLKQVPASFRLLGMNVSLFDKQNNPMGTAFTVDREQLRQAFSTPVPIGGYQPFNATGGHSAQPDYLEPGESIVGCFCSKPADRGASGYAKVEVAYEPVVWVDQLALEAAESTGNGISQWKGTTKVRGMSNGQATYFLFTPPTASSHPVTDLQISLSSNSQTELYTRMASRGWSWNQAEWSKGRLTSAQVKAGDDYWVLVRSQADGGSADVVVTYTTQGSSETGRRAAMGFQPVRPDNTEKSAFKAILFGLGEASVPKTDGKAKQRPCCSGSTE